MSAHYSKFLLNTYATTPYFQAQLPEVYPLDLVLQKRRAFRRLPENLRRLSELAKQWAERYYEVPGGIVGIDDWYDEDGYELDPESGSRLSDEEIDRQWDALHLEGLDEFKVGDIPVPDGGFADPEEWQPPPETEEGGEGREQPSREQLLRDISSHGRKRVAQAYGIPQDKLPGGLPKNSLPTRRK